jgi:hypothetical protein
MTKRSKPKERRKQQPPAEPAEIDKRPPDEASPRAKSSAHKKVTADKWNQ